MAKLSERSGMSEKMASTNIVYSARDDFKPEDLYGVEPTLDMGTVSTDYMLYNQTTGETTMNTLRTLNLTLVDNNENLKGAQKIVFQSLSFITEHSDEQTIQQILMTGDVKEALDKHNKMRVNVIDKAIQRNTGRGVKLEEVEIFDLNWQVVRVA